MSSAVSSLSCVPRSSTAAVAFTSNESALSISDLRDTITSSFLPNSMRSLEVSTIPDSNATREDSLRDSASSRSPCTSNTRCRSSHAHSSATERACRNLALVSVSDRPMPSASALLTVKPSHRYLTRISLSTCKSRTRPSLCFNSAACPRSSIDSRSVNSPRMVVTATSRCMAISCRAISWS